MKALLLSAGFGTRLGELTKDTPKPLLPLGNEPLIALNLRYLAANGFNDVAINTHYHADKIKEFVGDGSRFGVRAHLVYEPEPLGTAGAVANLNHYFVSENFFLVMYGDLLIDQNLGDFISQHKKSAADGTILVHRRANSNSIVRVAEDWQITDLIERPEDRAMLCEENFVNSGMYLLSCAVLPFIPRGASSDFPKDIFPAMLKAKKRLFAFPQAGYRCAIDSEQRYHEALQAVKSGQYRAA